MPNMLNSGDLIASIQLDLADNNAGLISAQDVRHNLEDTAFSINHIVASGDTNIVFPFFNILRTSKADAEGEDADVNPTHGDIVVESGIFFPNGPEPVRAGYHALNHQPRVPRSGPRLRRRHRGPRRRARASEK